MSVAVIPARGGSKRIPGKNIRLFAGQPVIAYSIQAARESGVFGRVLVSTDDQAIAEVALRYGAEVPFLRPAALADDHCGTDDVMAHAVSELEAAGEPPGLACCIYATAPMIRAADIRAGLDLMGKGVDFAFSATTYAHPVFRAFKRSGQGGVEMVMPEHYHSRSQDLPVAWHDAAQFYWGTASAWRERRTVFGNHSAIVALPRWRVQDIDTPEDWERAELLFRLTQEMPND